MKRKSWKWILLSRNAKAACILLAGLALSGLFGCSKVQEYTVAVDGMEETCSGQEGMEALSDGSSIEYQKSVEENPEPVEQAVIYVDICGAVKYPGVYKLSGDARLFEAIERAGGLSEKACARSINQAEKLCDGQKIYVPTVEEWERGDVQEDFQEKVSRDDGLININTADEAKLCELPGVGESRAKAILQYREEHGDFKTIEEIQNVSGIKSGLFAKIRDLIKVQ